MKCFLFIAVLFLPLLKSLKCQEVYVYDALKGNSPETLNRAIEKVEETNSLALYNAYLGALYMKKASFVRAPKDRMTVFNKGKDLLENEIKKNHNNIELRFLRLMIQENSPPILKYKNELEDDKAYIIDNFTKASGILKDIIRDFSSVSKILDESFLK